MLKVQCFEIFSALLCLQILIMNNDINPAELDFLLRYPVQPGATSPVDFLSNHSWGGIKVQSYCTFCCFEKEYEKIVLFFFCLLVLFCFVV